MDLGCLREAVAAAVHDAAGWDGLNVHPYPPADVRLPAMLVFDRPGDNGLAVDTATYGLASVHLTVRLVVPAASTESAARVLDRIRSEFDRDAFASSPAVASVASSCLVRGWTDTAATSLATALTPIVGAVATGVDVPVLVSDMHLSALVKETI